MENKFIYLTKLGLKKSLGNKFLSNEIAKEINKDFKGEITKNFNSEKLIFENYWMPVSRKQKENQDIIYNTIKLYGNFLTRDELKTELICAKNLSDEDATKDLKAVLANKRQFFSVNKKWGIADFCLKTESSDNREVIYLNYINEEELNSLKQYFEDANFDDENYADTISNILDKNNLEKISLKTALYFIWLSDKSLFDNKYILEDIDKSKKLNLIDGYLFTEKTIKSYLDELIKDNSSLNDLSEEKVKPVEVKEEIKEDKEVEEEDIDITLPKSIIDKLIQDICEKDSISLKKLIEEYYSDDYYSSLDNKEETIEEYLTNALKDPRIEFNGSSWYTIVHFEEEDKEDIIEMIKEKETLNSEYIIKEILGVSKKHPKFNDLSKEIEKLLEGAKGINYLGDFTWGLPLDIPEEANFVPEALNIEEILPSENAEGDVFDQEISNEGFEGTLKSDIYNPLCEDVFDEDSSKTIYKFSENKQKCVLKYHHKLNGTFPLCQIPPDFFGNKSEVFTINVIDDNNNEKVFVNNNTRLILGLEKFYENITDISGKIFFLEKTENSNEYKFTLGEVEKSCYIENNRGIELLSFKERLEKENMSLFDIICEILEKRPIDFCQLITEVNLVKRVSRLMIASILSSYHCFNYNKKNGKWNLDEKKIDLGFNKTKKKYIIKK